MFEMGPLNFRFTAGLSRLLALASLGICAIYAQPSTVSGSCVVTAVPSQVRSEGITERMGDIPPGVLRVEPPARY